MAKITHVKKAQQRFEMVQEYTVTLDGDRIPKQSPVRNPDGSHKTDKRGNLIWRNVTYADRSKPLPPNECGRCRTKIFPGDPYKHVTPKSGPYGSTTLIRCAKCPDWQVWELSSSLSARVAQIVHEAEENAGFNVSSPEEVLEYASETAQQIRDLADEKRESAENIESGFGHSTSASEELTEIADSLEGWADDLEGLDVEDLPEPEAETCPTCDGEGTVEGGGVEFPEDGEQPCPDCKGEGEVTPEDPTDEQMEEWREQAWEAFSDALSNCPV